MPENNDLATRPVLFGPIHLELPQLCRSGQLPYLIEILLSCEITVAVNLFVPVPLTAYRFKSNPLSSGLSLMMISILYKSANIWLVLLPRDLFAIVGLLGNTTRSRLTWLFPSNFALCFISLDCLFVVANVCGKLPARICQFPSCITCSFL